MKALATRVKKLEAKLNPPQVVFAPLMFDPLKPRSPDAWPWSAENPMPKPGEWHRLPGFDPRRQLTF